MKPRAKVFLVDDHPVVCDCLKILLNQQPDLTVTGTAGTIRDALTGIAQTQPDVALIDMALGKSFGLDLIKDLAAQLPVLRLLVLSMHDEAQWVQRALQAGAHGYITKTDAAACVVTGIRQVLAGNCYVSTSLAGRVAGLLHQGSRNAPTGAVALSDREHEVATLVGKGCETGEICALLSLSSSTVRSYYKQIKQKRHLRNGHQFIAWCAQHYRCANCAGRV